MQRHRNSVIIPWPRENIKLFRNQCFQQSLIMEKYDSYSASLYSEKIAGKETDQQLLLPTNQPFTISLRVVFINKISERHHYK